MNATIIGIQDVSRSIASRGLFASQSAFDLGAQAMKKTADALGEAAIKVKSGEAQAESEEQPEPAEETSEDTPEEAPSAE